MKRTVPFKFVCFCSGESRLRVATEACLCTSAVSMTHTETPMSSYFLVAMPVSNTVVLIL